MKQMEWQTDERSPIRERWTALDPGQSDEALAGSLLRSAAAVPPLGAREISEVSARLRSKERFRPRPLALQLAIALVLILFGSALSAGVSHVLRVRSTPAAKPGLSTAAPESARHHRAQT